MLYAIEETIVSPLTDADRRQIGIYSVELDTWLEVEEQIDVSGMVLSCVETGMQFLDNHNSWGRSAILGRVTAARSEDSPMSARGSSRPGRSSTASSST